ncbi:hypothetical protein COOONC_15070, partial [Cooperia oncophora]
RSDGVVTYGAVDQIHCGPIIAYEPLTTPTHWQFKLTTVTSGNFSTSGRGIRARSATASSYIGAPFEEADAIAQEHGATHYIIDCAAKPTLVFTIGQQNYTVQSDNLIVPIPCGRCIFALKPMPREKYGPVWTLGIPFHRQYCTIHDFGQERIGFR